MEGGHFEVHLPDSLSHALKKGHGLTVAVVGCGYWGSKHIRVLSGLADVGQIVVVDPDPRIRATILSVFPAASAFPDLQSALPYVDAVIVATPPHTHGDVAMQALRHGKHVLVEKPLTKSLDEAQRLVAEARRVDKILMVGHTFLFNPVVRELGRRLNKGELGSIYYIHSARLNLGLYRPDVNVVWDLAPHDIAIMNYLLQAVPTTVSAWGALLACEGVEDVAYIRLDYRQLGITGYCHLSWLDPRKERTITVVGKRKMAVYDDLAEERLRIYDRGVSSLDDGAPSYERPLSYRYGDIISPHIRFEEPLALEDQHFVDCIRDNVMPDTAGLNGMVVIAILEAIDRALKTGTPVDVHYPFDLSEIDGRKQDQRLVG